MCKDCFVGEMKKLKRKLHIILILTLASLMFSACSEKRKLYKKNIMYQEKNEYSKAIEKLAELLKLDPNNKKLVKDFEDTVIMSRRYYENKIKILEMQDKATKYEELLDVYKNLIKINKNIAEVYLDEGKNKIKIIDYSRRIEPIKDAGAKFYYEFAKRKEKTANNKWEHRSIAKAYKKVLEFRKNYNDADKLYKSSKEKAMLNVLILPIKNYTSMSESIIIEKVIYNNGLDWLMMDREISEFCNITSYAESRWLKYINDEEKNDFEKIKKISNETGIDIIVTSQIDSILYRDPTVRVEKTYLESSVKYKTEKVWSAEEEKYISKDIYKDVYATRYDYEKDTYLTINLSSKMIDPHRNRIMDIDTMTISVRDKVEWHSFSGNERAYDSYSQDELYCKTLDELLYEAAKEMSEKYRKKISYFLK